MRIGILVAMQKEVNSLVNFLNAKKIENSKKFIIYKALTAKHEIFIVRTNVGEIDAAISTQFLIDYYQIDLIINYGVVGLINKNINPNKLMIVKKVVHYDIDTSLIDNIESGRYLEFESVYIPVKFYKLDGIANILNLTEVICASGDKFIANETDKINLINNFNADICEMEIGGIALTCYRNDIELISIKGASDYCSSEEYNDKKVKEVSEVLTFKIIELLKLI
ncbi:MAG: 5'-methylthioadenosine/S-adenosylhomocysteine nucleosidase [Mollicutes bacterium]|nr:5'-methylthioadenosine/S-adenosylhomocysteine nucleosidase [Mollicutes bacterium]